MRVSGRRPIRGVIGGKLRVGKAVSGRRHPQPPLEAADLRRGCVEDRQAGCPRLLHDPIAVVEHRRREVAVVAVERVTVVRQHRELSALEEEPGRHEGAAGLENSRDLSQVGRDLVLGQVREDRPRQDEREGAVRGRQGGRRVGGARVPLWICDVVVDVLEARRPQVALAPCDQVRVQVDADVALRRRVLLQQLGARPARSRSRSRRRGGGDRGPGPGRAARRPGCRTPPGRWARPARASRAAAGAASPSSGSRSAWRARPPAWRNRRASAQSTVHSPQTGLWANRSCGLWTVDSSARALTQRLHVLQQPAQPRHPKSRDVVPARLGRVEAVAFRW